MCVLMTKYLNCSIYLNLQIGPVLVVNIFYQMALVTHIQHYFLDYNLISYSKYGV